MEQYDEDGNCRDCLAHKGTEHKVWCHLEMVRRIREEAWDEGYDANAGDEDLAPCTPNPYRG